MLAPVLEQFQKKHPKEVRIVSRHFPLPSHDKGLLATQGAEAAGLQGKFWEMHLFILERQQEWGGFTLEAMETWLKDQAKALGLDEQRFAKDLKSDAMVQKALKSRDDAMKSGISGTPFLLLNGTVYEGGRDPEGLEGVLEVFKLSDRLFKECPAMSIDKNKNYQATLKTSKGDIVIKLYAGQAPTAVNSFIFLARKGWFNNVAFHRVLTGFVAQAGDPSGTGLGGPGYAFGNEISVDLKYDKEGVVGMANAGPDTNGSQFFITYAPLKDLNGKYTIFGQVVQGMDVAKKLTPRDPDTGVLATPDKIISVTIEEK